MTGPYGNAAGAYWTAGWRGVLPLPAKEKKYPPKGRTGRMGEDVSYPDMYAWQEDRPEGNICLRMPHHVVGLDVDAYGEKMGGQTLAMFEAMHGTLPPTWRSSSRDDKTSGIRFYRVPDGLEWPGELDGGGIEIIQRRHRYAVVAPSIHPEGGTYRWYTPDGHPSLAIPSPDDLPELPEAWVQAITGGRLASEISRIAVDEKQALGWVASQAKSGEKPCPAMAQILVALQSSPQSKHDSMNTAVLTAVRYAEGGHSGAADILGAIRKYFRGIVTAPGYEHPRTESEADSEWLRSVKGAVGICLGDPGPQTCDCYGQLSTAIIDSIAPAAPTADGTTPPAPDVTPALQAQPEATAELENPLKDRFKPGAAFILDQPTEIPTIWGSGDSVIWAEGEALMIAAPPGVGKTTLAGQVVRARIFGGKVLGYDVEPTSKKILYLAMDRPRQIARSLRRHFTEHERHALDENLLVWEGPLPGDVAKNTGLLAALGELADADTIVVDSLKDAAIGLTEDEVGATYNLARQKCLAKGIEVLELHHMVKRGADGKPPTTLADVYGSMHLTSGVGSVLVLWGQGGDLMIELRHLKQPADDVGPLQLIHDHDLGVTSIQQGTDVLQIVAHKKEGVTAREVAQAIGQKETVTEGEKLKAQRKLDKLVSQGHLVVDEDIDRGWRGQPAKVWKIASKVEIKATVKATHPFSEGMATESDQGHGSRSDQGHAKATMATNAKATKPDPPLGGGPVGIRGSAESVASRALDVSDCNACGVETADVVIDQTGGYCWDCGERRNR